MSVAKITLFGMNKYVHDMGGDLFANLSTPTGLNKDELVDTILFRGGEFEVLFADSDYMKYEIGIWSVRMQRTMKRWLDVLSMEYNPIENYDRNESWVDSRTETEKTSRAEIANGMDTSSSTGSGSTDNGRSAYNSSIYQPHDNSESSSEGKNASTSVTGATGNTDSNNSSNGLHTGKIHGNIGVKTTQSMVEEELNISKFNIYDELAELFISEFCIYLY